jgi:hypothetical protein
LGSKNIPLTTDHVDFRNCYEKVSNAPLKFHFTSSEINCFALHLQSLLCLVKIYQKDLFLGEKAKRISVKDKSLIVSMKYENFTAGRKRESEREKERGKKSVRTFNTQVSVERI